MKVAHAIALLGMTALAGCSGSTTAFSPAQNAPAIPDALHAAKAAWSRTLMRAGLPNAGCFTAAYPAMTWTRITCSPPQHLIHGRMPATIGSWLGDDFVHTKSNMTMAIGSFPSVTGVTKIKTINQQKGHNCSSTPGQCGANIWGMQINTQYTQLFQTSACNGAKPAGSCAGGWEQFFFGQAPKVYSNKGVLGIEEWLIGKSGKPIKHCPPGQGWDPPTGGSCTRFSPTVSIPYEPITQLDQYVFSGAASRDGISIYFSDGSAMYGMKNVQPDTIHLVADWKTAEFNIFGNCCAYEAVLNPGSKITVSLEAVTGDSTAPVCLTGVGTGEQNSLSFVAAPTNPKPEQYPSILFTESNVSGGGKASCDALPAASI